MQATAVAKKEGPKRKLWIVLGSVAGLLLVGFLLVTVGGRIADRRAAGQVQTGNVVATFIGDLSASATASGPVESSQVTRLSANSPGVVTDVLVRVGETVSAGDVLAQLEIDSLILQVERAQQNLALREANLEALLDGAAAEDIASAEAALFSAQISLDNLLAGPSQEEIAESLANIRAQQAGVASASASYNSTSDSVSASAIASAEAELLDAQITYDEAKEVNERFAIAGTHENLENAAQNLAIARQALDELLAGPNQGSINSAASGVAAAVANLDQTQANHEALLIGPSAAQIAAAEASLAQMKANLARLTAGASAEDSIIAEAEVEQARLALLDAEEALAKATIMAPFDGVVTAVYVTEGEYATGNILEIVSDDLEVILSVDEIDVGMLAVGQPAVITLETWPADEIAGQIGAIAPSAGNDNNGLVTYDVKIDLEENELPILVGMTANARLIIASKENVLLIPNAAITADREAGTYTVNLVTGEVDGPPSGAPTTEKVEVTIGLKDGDFTQITGGLSEGDEVVIGELVAPTQGFGPRSGGPGFDGD